MSSPQRLRRNRKAEGSGPASPITPSATASASSSSLSPQLQYREKAYNRGSKTKSKSNNTLTVHHYHHFDDQKHIHHHVDHRKSHPQTSLSPKKRKKGKITLSTKRMCITGILALLWSLLTAVYVFRSADLPDVSKTDEAWEKRKESFTRKQLHQHMRKMTSTKLTPRELVYDPVRKGAPSRARWMGAPKNSTAPSRSSALWEFAELRVGVPPVKKTKRELTASHSAEVLEAWCPQPFTDVLDSPKLVVATDYIHDVPPDPDDPETFHYVAMNYRSFYADSNVITDERLEPASGSYNVNATVFTRVPEPRVYNSAVCRIRETATVKLSHFAHAMEEIYKCFGYWIESGANAPTTNVTPVLLYNKTTQGKDLMYNSFQKNTFMRGIKQFLTSQLGLKVMTTDDYYRCHFPAAELSSATTEGMYVLRARAMREAEVCNGIYHPDQTIRTYNSHGEYGYYFEHAAEWNRLMNGWLNSKEILRKRLDLRRRAKEKLETASRAKEKLEAAASAAKGKSSGAASSMSTASDWEARKKRNDKLLAKLKTHETNYDTWDAAKQKRYRSIEAKLTEERRKIEALRPSSKKKKKNINNDKIINNNIDDQKRPGVKTKPPVAPPPKSAEAGGGPNVSKTKQSLRDRLRQKLEEAPVVGGGNPPASPSGGSNNNFRDLLTTRKSAVRDRIAGMQQQQRQQQQERLNSAKNTAVYNPPPPTPPVQQPLVADPGSRLGLSLKERIRANWDAHHDAAAPTAAAATVHEPRQPPPEGSTTTDSGFRAAAAAKPKHRLPVAAADHRDADADAVAASGAQAGAAPGVDDRIGGALQGVDDIGDIMEEAYKAQGDGPVVGAAAAHHDDDDDPAVGGSESVDVKGEEEEKHPPPPARPGRRRLTAVQSKPGTTGEQPVTTVYPSGACVRPPRIGFLNRRKTRIVLNADDLAADLSELVYVYRGGGGTAKNETRQVLAQHPVEVIFFEDKEFIEQVEFFRRTDILISGHGAQLTGLPFMATDLDEEKHENSSCKQVVEFFPKDYGLPYFFGSLAVQSGLHHSYVYYDDGLDMVYDFTGPALPIPPRKDLLPDDRHPLRELRPWERASAQEYKGRLAARKFKFCPRRDDTVEYVAELIMEWYRCHGCGGAVPEEPAARNDHRGGGVVVGVGVGVVQNIDKRQPPQQQQQQHEPQYEPPPTDGQQQQQQQPPPEKHEVDGHRPAPNKAATIPKIGTGLTIM